MWNYFTGSTVYFVESLDTFAANLAHTQPTVFLAVPRIWEKMQEGILKKCRNKNWIVAKNSTHFFIDQKMIRKKLGLARARHIFTGASPINPALLHWYARLGIIIQEAYGMTENVALSHVNKKKMQNLEQWGSLMPVYRFDSGKTMKCRLKRSFHAGLL